ncbi:MAG: SDR family NAD(P)-dependent oxidoreductase [Planctomycetota bacterium]
MSELNSKKKAVVTGTTSGLGMVLASLLADAGWDLVLINRSRERTESMLEGIRAKHPDRQAWVYTADLSDQDDVRAAAEQVLHEHPTVHALFNIAGVLTREQRVSKHGHDLNLQVNTIAPWMLTRLLRPALAAGAAEVGRAVVVTVSSSAIANSGPLRVDGLSQPAKQGLFGSYAQSKLALTLATSMLARELDEDGVHIYAVDPGANRTPMTTGSSAPRLVRWAQALLPPPEKGAAKLIAPLDDSWADRSGSLIARGKVKPIPKQADTPANRAALEELLRFE